MQFSGNSVQKRVNLCKERNKSDILMINNQRNSQIANQMRVLDVATKFENLKIWKLARETMAGVLSRLSFATAAEKQLKNCKKHCFLVVSLEKVVFREGNCRGNRKLQADPA